MTVTEIPTVGTLLPSPTVQPEDVGQRLAARAEAAALVLRLARGAAADGRSGTHQGDDGPVWDRADEYKQAVYREAWLNSLQRGRHTDYARFRLNDLDRQQYPQVLAEWVRDVADRRAAKLHMVLFGGVGSGKTTAGIALGNAAVQAGVMTRYVRHADYLRWLRPDGAPPGMTEVKVREFHDRCELLILDELCGDMDTHAREFVRRETSALLDARIASRLPTLVGTNESSGSIAEILGDRFVSRLGGRAVALEFKAPDRRQPVTWGRPRTS